VSVRGRIAQIHRSAFAHPEDQAALESLSRIPVLPAIQKALAAISQERLHHAQASMNQVRLGRGQFPSLYRIVCSAAESLGIPVPDAYLSNQNMINAFAFGMNRYTVTLTAALVDVMTDAEIEAIVAHELGHIVCEHMLYRTMGTMLAHQAVSSFVPMNLLTSASTMLYAGLQRWSRAAEYSADRVALLVTNNPEQVAAALGRLACPTSRYAHEYNPHAMLDQIPEEADASLLTKMTLFRQELFLSHPEPVKRIHAIMEWSRSEQYHSILAGRFQTRAEHENLNRIQIAGVRSCPACCSPVGEVSHCGYCGLPQDPARHGYCENNHVNDACWKFCRTCGAGVMGASDNSLS
jgi:Zn-dependent protease with chaperone function